MKRLFPTTFFFGLFLFSAALPARAAGSAASASTPKNPTAYAALRAVQNAVGGNVLERIVEVSGRDGVPQPYLWRVVLREANGSTREVAVAGAKVTTQRSTSGRPAPGPGTLHLQDLNLDSSGAFDAAEAQARKVRVRFDSLNYVLQVGENGKPAWTLELFNQDGTSIGRMHLAAHDGTVASITGRLGIAPDPALVSTRPTTPGRGNPSAMVEPRLLPPPSSSTSTAVVSEPRSSTTTTVVTRQRSSTIAPDDGQGGFFTRAGRTLDHTNDRVAQSFYDTNDTVKRGFKRTGVTIQRFFTGRNNLDREDNRN